MYIGTPPQRQTVILDTGSSILAFPCTGFAYCMLLTLRCNGCGSHQNGPFNPSLSKSIKISHPLFYFPPSFHPVGCDETMYKGKCSSSIRYRFSPLSIQSYLEGSSLGGPLYWDTLWLGGNIEDESHVPVGTVQSSNLFGVRQQFGCAVNFNGLFKSQLADGIIGLAPRGEYMWFLSFQRCPTLVIFKATFRVCVR